MAQYCGYFFLLTFRAVFCPLALDDLLVTLMTYSNYGRGRHLPYVTFGTGSFLGLPDAEGIFCIAGPGWQYSQSRLCSSFWFSSVEV